MCLLCNAYEFLYSVLETWHLLQLCTEPDIQFVMCFELTDVSSVAC